MEDIFKIRELGICKKEQVDVRTAFTYYEIKQGEEIHNNKLPLYYMLFMLDGVIEINCDKFENYPVKSKEMILLPRSSSVKCKVITSATFYVMYFDALLSSCDRQFFKAYLPEVRKSVYDFSSVSMPYAIQIFFEQMLFYQRQKVDCMHFNSLKHSEFFILLRHFCPRDELVSFMYPLISGSQNFRAKVLDNYMSIEGGGVPKLAELVGMGRKNFDKYFHEEFETSPAKWLQQEKAKHVQMFLGTPGVTIQDAIDKFHFNSSSHFNRFCRQYFNMTPGDMIKEGKK